MRKTSMTITAVPILWAIFFYLTRNEPYLTKMYWWGIGGVMTVVHAAVLVAVDKFGDKK